MITITDDYCNDATTDIMIFVEKNLGSMDEVTWERLHRDIFDLLAKKFQSNGYVNHN